MHSLFTRIIHLLNNLKAEIFNSLFCGHFTAIDYYFNPNESGIFEVSPPFIFHEQLM